MNDHKALYMTSPPYSIDRSRVQRIVDLVERDIEAITYDGIALKVSVGEEVVIDVRRGFADRAKGVALDETTCFASMSTGKNFLAALFLSYVERGLLNLM